MIFVSLLVLTFILARIAQLMAVGSGRSVRLWIWLAVLTGPVAVLTLAALPRQAIRA